MVSNCHQGNANYLKKSVNYVGHVVSEEGVKPDPDKIEALVTWPTPTNIKQQKSFLGFCGYYRRFVEDYSKILKLLNDLTAGYLPPKLKQKHRTKSNPTIAMSVTEPFGDRWTIQCQRAMEIIIDRLTKTPVLAFADLLHMLAVD
ncbi:uncharacterized protein LOC144363091 [Saccoglossus kowalevskii]